MNCNCTVVNVILGAVIFVLALWPWLLATVDTSLWVIVVASALIMVHSVMHNKICQKCGTTISKRKK
ncbi:MAG: hypothetical protein Q8L29_03795 [archaeon]|nr:hypothetical protein [archaeon]